MGIARGLRTFCRLRNRPPRCAREAHLSPAPVTFKLTSCVAKRSASGVTGSMFSKADSTPTHVQRSGEQTLAPVSPEQLAPAPALVPINNLYFTSLSALAPRGYLDRAGEFFPTITERQREKVVAYICDLCEDFTLRMTTAHLAVNYFDRWTAKQFCLNHEKQDRVNESWKKYKYAVTRVFDTKLDNSDCADHIVSFFEQPRPDEETMRLRRSLLKRQIQIDSCVCILMASKFDDLKLPPLGELVKALGDNMKVTKEELATRELAILQGIEWKLNAYTPYAFLGELLKICDDYEMDDVVRDHTYFFLDLSVHNYKMLKYHPLLLAAASFLIALKRSYKQIYKTFGPRVSSACRVPKEDMKTVMKELKAYRNSRFGNMVM